MILTATEIEKQVKAGHIIIQPFDKAMINPNSYNYRLGEYLTEIEDDVIDPKSPVSVKTFKIPPEGHVLLPGKLYLGHTFEVLGSQDYVTSLIGRSSVGRLGLYLQITADLGQLGNAHRWTLELTVVQPLRVYPFMRIGQVSFWKPSGENSTKYSEGYTAYNLPQHSKYHKEISA